MYKYYKPDGCKYNALHTSEQKFQVFYNDLSKYYARNAEEKAFDDEMRSKVYENGTKAEMILYIQNQTILNMLRHIEDELQEHQNIS